MSLFDGNGEDSAGNCWQPLEVCGYSSTGYLNRSTKNSMNRTRTFTPTSMMASSNTTGKSQDWMRRSTADQVACRFYSPIHYEAKYSYPLVVWLHSDNSSEWEMDQVLPEISDRNYVGVAPRGTHRSDPSRNVFSWNASPVQIALAEELIFSSIKAAIERFNIHSQRIFLAGYGGGGSMAWRIALRYPQQFAGAICLNGMFPEGNRPLIRLREIRSLPALWMFGAQSQKCNLEHVNKSLNLLNSGGLRVDLQQYDCGDELFTDMLSGTNRWIMDKVNAVENASHESCIFSVK